MRGMTLAVPKKEEGFTLLEILLAMMILAVGGVGILSLFAAAVGHQYRAVVKERQAAILTSVVSEMQQRVNEHTPTPERPLPADIALRPVEGHERDFQVEVKFSAPGAFPPGEGAIANITLYYRGGRPYTVMRVLQRTVFAKSELKSLVSYDRDKKADAEAEAEKDDGYSGPPK
jgi:prepilin-type N-terminal cleavage/methylation domain-containing protein